MISENIGKNKKICCHINNIKVESNNELKEIDTNNLICYYFGNKININDLYLTTILLDEKSYKNILFYDLKTLHAAKPAKPLCIIFDKVDGYIRKHDGIKFLVLIHSNEKYERMFDRIRYLIMLKSSFSDVYSHKYTKIKINSDDD